MPYLYPVREVAVDGVIHALGLTVAVIGAALLLLHLVPTATTGTISAVAIYLAFLVLAFVASAAYHLSPFDRPRDLLHRIDHATIYLKIAGTYTPLVVMLGGILSYCVLALVWVTALIGAWAKLRFWSTDAKGSLSLYLGMGWAAVVLFPSMVLHLPAIVVILVVKGGVLYTLGTIVFARKSMPFQNAIWHGFVLAASACFFGAISTAVLHAG